MEQELLLVFLFLSLGINGQLTKNNYLALSPLVKASASNNFGCTYLGDQYTPGPFLIWTLNQTANQMNAVMYAINTGWMAFGVTRATGNVNPMFNSDAVMGTRNFATVNPVDDYYTLPTIRGNGLDINHMGTDDVSGNFSFDTNTGISTFMFTRKITSTDSNDANLMLGQSWEYLWSMSTQSDTSQFHDNGFNYFYMDLNAVPTCPSVNSFVCSGAGTCINGCCSCNNGSYGYDCSLGAQPVLTNSTLTATINPTDYVGHYADPTGFYNLYWKVIGNIIEVAISMNGLGWVAFGPSPNSQMPGSDVIVAWYDPATGPAADDFLLTDRLSGCPGVCRDTQLGGTNDVLAVNGSQINGVTQLKWRRLLVTSDTIGDHPIIADGKTYIPVVYGFNLNVPGPTISQHDTNTKGVLSVNILLGNSAVSTVYQIVHGLGMFIAWAFIIPIGAVVARYLKQYTWWFNVHRMLNSFAVALIIVAFIFAVLFTTDHLYSYHAIIGMIVVSLGFIQPVIGTIADKWFRPERGFPPFFPDIVHWIIGWVSLFSGLANVALGIEKYNEEYGGVFPVLIAYIIYGGLVAIALIGIVIWKFIQSYKNSQIANGSYAFEQETNGHPMQETRGTTS